MNPSIQLKLENLAQRFEERAGLMADPSIQNEQNRFRALGKEYAQLEPLVLCFRQYSGVLNDLEYAQTLLQDSDPDVRAMAKDELESHQARQEQLEHELQILLLPKDPDDEKNTFLEIRAGTGGVEASLFAADLQRMYLRYAEKRGWKTATISASASELGGYKEVVIRVAGDDVFSRLKFESGAHRVQRVRYSQKLYSRRLLTRCHRSRARKVVVFFPA